MKKKQHKGTLKIVHGFKSSTTLTRSSMDINSDGNCYPEAYLQVPELCGGNIREKKLIEIWNSDKWSKLRTDVNEKYSIGKGCGECELANICSQGAPSAKYYKYRNFTVQDPHCKFKM